MARQALEAISTFSGLRRSSEGHNKAVCERAEAAERSQRPRRPIRRMQGWFPWGITPFPFCGECGAVEERDGIGGEMAVARKWQAAGGKSRGTGAQVRAVNPGKAMLIAEADKTLKKESAKIVKALLESLIECKNATAAKLLFDLADGLIDCENQEVMSQLCSYAASLGSEQQLGADAADAEAETELAKVNQRDDVQALVMTTNTN